jgi:hypothetical protein
MTRHLDADHEDRQVRKDAALVAAVNFGIVNAVQMNGRELLGFSVRMDEWETLITLRAVDQGERLVAFVGAETLPSALIKVVREGKRDKLVWRADEWARDST